MNEFAKKISYLQGLADGVKISEKSEEGTLIVKLIEVLNEAADEIDALWNKNNELETVIAAMDEELYAVNLDIEELIDTVEDLSDNESESYDDFDYDDDDDDDLFDFYGDDDDDLLEILCPECGEDIVIDYDMLDEENNIVCPHCHQSIDLDFDIDDLDELDDEE